MSVNLDDKMIDECGDVSLLHEPLAARARGYTSRARSARRSSTSSRDMRGGVGVKPVKTPACNWSFHLPGKPGEGEMPCFRTFDPPATRTFWGLEDDDDLDAATTICFQTWGFTEIRAVILGYGDGDQASDVALIPDGHLVAPGVQWPLTLTDQAKDYLRNGGYFISEVPKCPPMPTNVVGDSHERPTRPSRFATLAEAGMIPSVR
jgi:hypothetical protein